MRPSWPLAEWQQVEQAVSLQNLAGGSAGRHEPEAAVVRVKEPFAGQDRTHAGGVDERDIVQIEDDLRRGIGTTQAPNRDLKLWGGRKVQFAGQEKGRGPTLLPFLQVEVR